MMKILVPVDGSRNTMHAVRHVANAHAANPAMEIHLLNVQAPFSRHIAQFASRKSIKDYHRDEATKALAPVRDFLDGRKVPYVVHTLVGSKAEAIAGTASRLRCDHIVMGTARKNSLTRMLEASVTNRVLELTTVPVEVIAGDAVSKVERYGIPIGIGTLVGLIWLAAD